MLLLSVLVGNNPALVSSETEDFAFFFLGKSLEVTNSGLHFILEDGEKRVLVEGHFSFRNTNKSRLESSLLDVLSIGRVLHDLIQLFEGTRSNLVNLVPQVLRLKILNHLQHVHCSVVEVLLQIQLLIRQVVDDRSLLDEFIFISDSNVV